MLTKSRVVVSGARRLAGDRRRRGVKARGTVAELIRTNDVAVISVAEGVLSAAGIPYEVADRNMSILEGSVGAIQMRILVPEEFEDLARQMLLDVDLGDWLRL